MTPKPGQTALICNPASPCTLGSDSLFRETRHFECRVSVIKRACIGAHPEPEPSFPMFLSAELSDRFQGAKYNCEASQSVSRCHLGTYAGLRAVDATDSRRSSSDHPCVAHGDSKFP